MSDEPLPRLTPTAKTGRERFRTRGAHADFSLLDFWSWSASDLVSNTTRGVLAEFIVAKALDVRTDGVRMEWDRYDLVTAGGLKIEVKSAAYIQTWAQRAPSKIVFSVKRARGWDADTNVQAKEARRHADVYVFALLDHRNQSTIDPLDLDQWRFWALSTKALDERKRSQHSITLATLLKVVGDPVGYQDLAEAVEQAGRGRN